MNAPMQTASQGRTAVMMIEAQRRLDANKARAAAFDQVAMGALMRGTLTRQKRLAAMKEGKHELGTSHRH